MSQRLELVYVSNDNGRIISIDDIPRTPAKFDDTRSEGVFITVNRGRVLYYATQRVSWIGSGKSLTPGGWTAFAHDVYNNGTVNAFAHRILSEADTIQLVEPCTLRSHLQPLTWQYRPRGKQRPNWPLKAVA